jgi:hypothetical protein
MYSVNNVKKWIILHLTQHSHPLACFHIVGGCCYESEAGNVAFVGISARKLVTLERAVPAVCSTGSGVSIAAFYPHNVFIYFVWIHIEYSFERH